MDVREKATIKYTCGAGTPEEAETNCTYFIRGECTASFCEYRRKKQTNADKIRSMTDEELAELLSEPCECSVDPEEDGYRECGNKLCIEYLLNWLQQPAEQQKEET